MKNLTLEVSLKPFYGLNAKDTQDACEQALKQWSSLSKITEQISILLWVADGSEILDYKGHLDTPMEWARFLGNGNAHLHPKIPGDPEGKSLHARSYLYRDDATQLITYRRLAEIGDCWRKAIISTGKSARVGLTFDPGGEFAPSSFKYERHREVCLADTLGKASFVCCYGVLNRDTYPYAGFPDGVPQDTNMGTFLGRQFAHIAKDLNFDYLWLSNGFGFGMETWMTSGPLFDGEHFTPEQAPETRDRILQFWKDFRKECPHLELETRGTNLSTGTDLASDATPLRELYEGDFNFAPPPNSPWAALNGDFGLELAGYLSRVVEQPKGKPMPFRFYIHDPWWLNSPWLDRYEQQPHDIYMPLSISRLNQAGGIEVPETLNLLSIDDSYGHMPDSVPNGTTPHLLRAWSERPDAAGPLVWLYPFDQLHDAMFLEPRQPERLFHNDWFVREAINNGLPINTVVSTRAFGNSDNKTKTALAGKILISPSPFDNTTEQQLIDWVESGESAIIYGPLTQAPELRRKLELESASPLSGAMHVNANYNLIDHTDIKAGSSEYTHCPIMSSGGLSESPTGKNAAQVVAEQEGNTRALVAHYVSQADGHIWWLRAPLPLRMEKDQHLPLPDIPGTSFNFGALNRQVLGKLGWNVAFERQSLSQLAPAMTVHRQSNGWFFSGYTPDTTVGLKLKTPFGAPLFLGTETWIEENTSTYRTPRGWRYECRVFVEQPESSLLSYKEELPGQFGVTRRMWVHGLKEATLRFFPPTDSGEVTIWLNAEWPYVFGNTASYKETQTPHGRMIETTTPIQGTVLFSW